MIAAAVVCPPAPALVPDVGQGIASELASARIEALAAVTAIIESGPDRVLVVGDGPLGEWDESAGGTFRPFGPDVRAGGDRRVLSPSLTVGAWLLDAAGWTGPRLYTSAPQADAGQAWLVMADGSSRQRSHAPEWTDVEGRAFDASVARALGDGDADALASLDRELAHEVGASGTEGLIALGNVAKGIEVDASLRYDDAPFGVGYWVADWHVRAQRQE